MKPGTKFCDLFILKNMRRITLRTARKRQSRRERSSRKKCRSSSSMVKTQWRWWQLISEEAMDTERSIEYLMPQEGQKRLLQVKGTNFMFPQREHIYIAPPKSGLPQFIILSMFSMTTGRGLSKYLISS